MFILNEVNLLYREQLPKVYATLPRETEARKKISPRLDLLT